MTDDERDGVSRGYLQYYYGRWYEDINHKENKKREPEPTLAGDGRSHIISICQCSSCASYRELNKGRSQADPSRKVIRRLDAGMQAAGDTDEFPIHIPNLMTPSVMYRTMHSEDLQQRVFDWMRACMGDEVAKNLEERNWRVAEECCELLEASGFPFEHLMQIAKHVYAKNQGKPSHVAVELGDMMFVLAAFANAHELHMENAANHIVRRNWENIDLIREKHKAKTLRSSAEVVGGEE